MRVALLALAALSLFGCGTVPPAVAAKPAASPSAASKAAAPTPAASPSAAPVVTDVSGAIAANIVWAHTIEITGNTTINPGVTVTVNPGTKVYIAPTPTLTIDVKGTLSIRGTSASPVTIVPGAQAPHFNRFVIPAGGQLTAHHLVMTGGGFTVAGGTLSLFDSAMSRSLGDLLQGNGTVDVEYSSIGLEMGVADTTHCDLHFNPGANKVKVTHSNISTAVYGMMFYGGGAADFTYDNWFADTIDVETLLQYPVSGDFSYGWFAKAAPSGPGVTANNLAAARLPAGVAGPRP